MQHPIILLLCWYGLGLSAIPSYARNFNHECHPKQGTGEKRFDGDIKLSLFRIQSNKILFSTLKWQAVSSPIGMSRFAFIQAKELQKNKDQMIKVIENKQVIVKNHGSAQIPAEYEAKVDATTDLSTFTVNLKLLPSTTQPNTIHLPVLKIPAGECAVLNDEKRNSTIVTCTEALFVAVGAEDCM